MEIGANSFPISTQKFKTASNQVNHLVEVEEGISFGANSAITFNLDELRTAGDISATEALRFVADRVGPNDAQGGASGVHAIVIIGDASGVLSGFINGQPVAITNSVGTFSFTGTIPTPLIVDTFASFNIPIPNNAKFVTLAAVNPSGAITDDFVAWSGARLEIDSRGTQNARSTFVISDIAQYATGTILEFPTTATTITTPGIDRRELV